MAFADSLHYRTSQYTLARPFMRLRSSPRPFAFERETDKPAQLEGPCHSKVLSNGHSRPACTAFFTDSSSFLWDFLSFFLASSRRMNSADEVWLSLLLITLFGLLLLLRIKFPGASRVQETAALAVTTFLFFSICNCFVKTPAATVQKASEAQTTMLTR